MCVVVVVKSPKIVKCPCHHSGNNTHTKAQSAYEEALEIYRTLAKVSPDAYLSEVAMTLNNIGSLY
jgi:hypothetical protein